MTRFCYIAGPYRHLREDGTYDESKMVAEIQDEAKWGKLVARHGMYPIRPLALTHIYSDYMDQEEWIEADAELLECLRPHWDCILLRPGAYGTLEESRGARRELDVAVGRNLIIIRGDAGDDVATEFIESLRSEECE
jgi:hypothetical protein